jgi:hypothetical protein
MAWCINEINTVVFPRTRRRCRRDCYSPFLFLLHPVHHGVAVMDFPHAVRNTSVIKDSLSRRGLARVDMSHDPDIPDLV